VTDPTRSPVPAPAKRRILDAADALFSGEGIRAVGVDRLIATAQVTKATFYKHFGSKDRLVVAYLDARHESLVALVENQAAAAADPVEAIRAVLEGILHEVGAPGNRGSAFLNAAAEHPDPRHPVREAVARHRGWLTEIAERLVTEMGHPLPREAADELVLTYEGALMGGYAGDAVSSAAVLGRVVERVIHEAQVASVSVPA
jgi:AcrR family transcriptional regulator